MKKRITKLLAVMIVISMMFLFFPGNAANVTYGSETNFFASFAYNMDDAHDGNYNTSAVITAANGYVTYSVDELGLSGQTVASIMMNELQGGSYDVIVKAFDAAKDLIPGSEETIAITGYKNTYIYGIPAGTNYIRVEGIAGVLCVYEIEALKTPFSKNASNIADSFDNNVDTSANIFVGGSIMYSLADLDIAPGQPVQIMMNADDNKAATVDVNYYGEGLESVGSDDIEIDEHKKIYTIAINPDTEYIEIMGLADRALYIYEIGDNIPTNGEPGPPAPPEDVTYEKANNISDAYDGNYNTSANIFEGGYIQYEITDLGFDPEMFIQFIMNGLDGNGYNVQVQALDGDENVIKDEDIEISGFKNSYRYWIPEDAVYLKIYGIDEGLLCIYEIEEIDDVLTFYANNAHEAYDKNYNTSANILRPDGYLIYKLDVLGVNAGERIYLTIGTTTGKDYDISVSSLGNDFIPINGVTTIEIDGYKDVYTYDIEDGAEYLMIYGVPSPETILCIYEIEKDSNGIGEPGQPQPPVGPIFSAHATNIEDAHDGNMETSANILKKDGFIIYALSTLGVTDQNHLLFTMNALNQDKYSVKIESLDSDLEPLATTSANIEGHKDTVVYEIHASATHIKISGIDDTMLNIWEIQAYVPPPDPDEPNPATSSVSYVNNEDRTGTILLDVRSYNDEGVEGLGLGDIEVYITGINTWDTLASLHAGSYWNIVLDEKGDGIYEILLVRLGSVPYTRNWIVRVNGIEIDDINVLITQPSWTGTWATVYTDNGASYDGEMVLTQSGSAVTGTYTYGGITGTITGTIEAFVLTGTSTELGRDYPFIFTMDPSGDFFTGLWWNDGEDDPEGEWNGIRQ